MTKATFLASANECRENASRLLDDAQMLEFQNPLATRYYLAVIAQEEAAKAFLLYLVTIEALPWSPFLLRSTRDHKCKHLVGIILDYIAPDMEEFLKRIELSRSTDCQAFLPASVADAMNLLYHEKIRRWESKDWFWAETPEYDESALCISEGSRDREKQRSLYVDLDRSGRITTTPQQVTDTQAKDEFDRARRFESCVRDLLDGNHSAWDLDRIETLIKTLFSSRPRSQPQN